jgi:tripartite-type tricarboxylate transporter receptor subunit TctC
VKIGTQLPLQKACHFLSVLSLLSLSLGFLKLAQAQSEVFPSRPISLVVGYPPGGSTDLTARTIAPELSKRLGVSVMVENVGGAGGSLGAQRVVNAKPDGYTLLLGANNELVIKKQIAPSTKYSVSDFTAIGLVASQPMVLVAGKKAGLSTLDEFVSKAKANPGKYSYGSSGVGTALHLAGELVKKEAGIFMTHIPYRGVAPLLSDLMGENIEYGFYVLSSALPHLKSGKLIGLATSEKTRSSLTPNIPALSEHPKLKAVELSSWFALMGPAKMPEAITQRLQKVLAEILQSPEIRKKFEESGATVVSSSINATSFIAEESAKVKRIVDFAKISEE